MKDADCALLHFVAPPDKQQGWLQVFAESELSSTRSLPFKYASREIPPLGFLTPLHHPGTISRILDVLNV